jgi:biopolymer transport protein TolR
MHAARPGQIRSEINVTPLVDVCLVLLIIFMVVTPILTNGPSIELPKAPKPEKKPQTLNQLPIFLVFDDPPQILFGSDLRWLAPDDLQRAARTAHEQSPDQQIVLRADRRLAYRNVKTVLRALRDAGIRDVGLVAEREPAKPTPP